VRPGDYGRGKRPRRLGRTCAGLPPGKAHVAPIWNTKPWSFDRFVENVRWRSSPRLRPLDPEALEDALRHVDVDPGWRKPLPTRGFCRAIYEVILDFEARGLNAIERQIAEIVGCSRSSVSRWKRWLKSHRYIEWKHVRDPDARWGRCVYVTPATVAQVQRLSRSDALVVITRRRWAGRGAQLPVRAEALLEEALSRAFVGIRNVTCYVMGRWLKRIGVEDDQAQEIACRYAVWVAQEPGQPRFTCGEALKCIRSAYKRRD
jgi:hypothetical protein